MIFVPAVEPAGDRIAIYEEDLDELVDAVGFGTEQNGVGALAGAEDEARSLDLFEASLSLWVERCDKTQGIGHDLFLSG